MKKLLLMAAILVASIQSVNAQKITWETGDLKVLEGQTAVATEIVYENILIGGVPEAQFLEERRATDNAEKPGAGDKFVENWNAAKKDKWPKRLNDYIFKGSKEHAKASADEAGAKYKIILKPNNFELGKGKYLGTKPALVDFVILIVEAANPSNVLAKGTALKVKGESKAPKGSGFIPGGVGGAMDVAARSQNFDATNRIAESFELLAIAIGKAMK